MSLAVYGRPASSSAQRTRRSRTSPRTGGGTQRKAVTVIGFICVFVMLCSCGVRVGFNA
jgi:hypothetical protein